MAYRYYLPPNTTVCYNILSSLGNLNIEVKSMYNQIPYILILIIISDVIRTIITIHDDSIRSLELNEIIRRVIETKIP